jgi:hypothetical protein
MGRMVSNGSDIPRSLLINLPGVLGLGTFGNIGPQGRSGRWSVDQSLTNGEFGGTAVRASRSRRPLRLLPEQGAGRGR